MIHLHGYLADKYGPDHNIIVKSAAEAIRALEANYRGFARSIKGDMYYSIVRGKDLNQGKDLSEEELTMQFDESDWHIIPVPEGAKSGGLFMMLLGAVLIVASFWVGGPAWLAPAMLKAGIGIAIGGLAQLMAPAPVTNNYAERERPEERASYLFDGARNKTEQGDAIPVVYGETFVGSVVVSAGIDVGDTND